MKSGRQPVGESCLLRRILGPCLRNADRDDGAIRVFDVLEWEKFNFEWFTYEIAKSIFQVKLKWESASQLVFEKREQYICCISAVICAFQMEKGENKAFYLTSRFTWKKELLKSSTNSKLVIVETEL